MVEERPTTIQTTPNLSTNTNNAIALDENQVKRKKSINIFGLFLLGLVASSIAGFYIYLNQGSEFSWQKVVQKLQPWKQKVEQLAPSN